MAGKPDQVLAKIAEGKVGKYYKEYCLFVNRKGHTIL